MGKSDYSRTVVGSDSGYGGDEATDRSSSSLHPLEVRKGYQIGPCAKLHIGDVFEFLWADCPEFEYEWKCLGYTRFIVLRHSDSFPMHCACVPISVGGKRNFAKPGIDTLQQGHVYASGQGERDRDRDSADPQTPSQHEARHPTLPYSPVGINLHSGRHKVKEDSRANYADVVEVDHEAQVMVVGDVVKYFDRIRKNVNKAFMRQILRDALGDYCERKRSESEAAGTRGWGNSTASLIKTGEAHPESGALAPDEVAPVNDPPEDAPPEHVQSEEAQPEEAPPEHVQPEPVHPGTVERAAEESSSDGRREEGEDWEPSISSNTSHPPRTSDHPSRTARAASRSGAHSRTRSRNHSRAGSPVREAQIGLRPGMDRAGLQSLRNLRRGAPSEEHDDTLSLRSLAMVGRTDTGSSRRSRR
ncbi:hypothetical protein KVR01_000009 [Diaporthe batatas]|uniref:uncharacterized protein n=1 Tax=Diaporthe batatas TaxID=748121 RepID=UPI001D03DFAC|nr:uncharacterized protein KVR01_000009 [Diaporthe batatas]KAG8169264.1 hypothetical protein KVR01_000009 [Diaporthe batatas]